MPSFVLLCCLPFVKLRMILFYGHPVFIVDNYRFLPGTIHCWPDLVSRIRFSQWPPIQTDSVRLCLVLCIYHLTIRFPPGGRTRLLLARSVFTCYCSEQRRVSGRHNQTKLGDVPDVTTGPAPRPLVTSHTMWSAANGASVTQCDTISGILTMSQRCDQAGSDTFHTTDTSLQEINA